MNTTRKPIKKSALMFMISIMTITLIFLVAVLIVSFVYFFRKNQEPTGVVMSTGEAIYTEDELNQLIMEKEEAAVEDVLGYIRESLQGGKSTVAVL